MTHQEFIDGLRRAADFFSVRPELGVPNGELVFNYAWDFPNGMMVDSKDGVAFFARTVGGKLEKQTTDSFYYLVAKRDGFTVKCSSYRQSVCEMVQVGTKIEPARVIPAQEEKFVPEQEIPVYEYRCPSILEPQHEGGKP